jgi:serine/threonine-protein kinase RsbW
MEAIRVFTSLEQLPELLDMAEELCRRAGLPEALAFKTQVVLEELFVNICKHAYQDKGGPARIAIRAENVSVCLRVEDEAPAFDPLAREIPDLQKRFEEGIPGGAGLLLVRSMTEGARYLRRENRNILEMRIRP